MSRARRIIRKLNEIIQKSGSQWVLKSHKGKNLGKFDTKQDAKDREKQINYFKYLDKKGK
jgi:hypothetical protein